MEDTYDLYMKRVGDPRKTRGIFTKKTEESLMSLRGEGKQRERPGDWGEGRE